VGIGLATDPLQIASDEALVQACRGGDQEAWNVLVERYRRLVYAIALRSGLDEDLAGEVFQRAFTLLVEHLERIERPDRLRSWLVTTASREARHVRQRQLPEPDLPEAAAGVPDRALLPDEVLVELEERHMLRIALASLDDRCRELLLLLFYRQDVPAYAEIAAQLGTSEGSIGPTRARCLAKLRQQLQSGGWDMPIGH
jgi:RNA polymerase sigma factor (sigma-70 family)